MSPTDPIHARYMAIALALARRGLGVVWPNPAVGCVLVHDHSVVARGWTQPGGRPHAETQALDRAGAAARGATAYVTLEPCCHVGQTLPCTEALLAAGIGRCVVATEDPDPRVSGRGIEALRDAGQEVITGVMGETARAVNAGFMLMVREQRPLIALKIASSLDGRIATRSGVSQWITGPSARATGHLMRACYDAVLIGIGTALADRPQLTCRLPGMADRSPVRVIVDSRLQLPLTSDLVATAKQVPTWLVTTDAADGRRRDAFAECGVEIIEVAVDDTGRPSLHAAVGALAARGITRLLVEGGGQVAAALFRADLVDRLLWFRAPMVLGGDARAAPAALAIDNLAAVPRFRRVASRPVGDDVLETYARVA